MHIVIVGGTSGIGLALAQQYLQANHVVTVCGRDKRKVPTQVFSPNLAIEEVDVGLEKEVAQFFSRFTEREIDVFIYCAGKYFNERRLTLSPAEQAEMQVVNRQGYLDCFRYALEHMKKQGHGHLAAVSSVAGLVKSSQPSLYSQLKSEMIDHASQLRNHLKGSDIKVSVIAPGYVNTQKLRDLNAGDASHKPFIVDENHAARHIVSQLKKERFLIVFPFRMKLLIRLLNLLPSIWVTYLLDKRS